MTGQNCIIRHSPQSFGKQQNKMKKTGIIAFTEHGCVLGEKLLRDLQKQDQEVYGFVKSKYVELPEKHPFRKVKGTLREWAEEWIPRLDGIIFFSATGIAVRTIAPFVVSKKTDPAVVVIDEQGSYAISLLSGHLGGANELTEFAAESIGAQPVITTGTDVNHTFAVDVFARKNNLVISDMELAKEMAALLIRGKTIVWGAGEGFVFPKEQTIPEQLRFRKTESPDGKQGTLWFAIPQSDREQEEALGTEQTRMLHLYPKNVYLGVGCRKNTPEEKIETQIQKYLSEHGIAAEQIILAASIDLKKEEPGLLAFCEKYHLPFVTYRGEELEKAKGTFTPSAFVSKITGVDNVCERSASLAGDGGAFIMRKQAAEGVTAACTIKKWSVSFE